MRVAFVAEVFVPKWSLGAGAPFIAFRIFVKPAVCAMRHVPREPGAGPNFGGSGRPRDVHEMGGPAEE